MNSWNLAITGGTNPASGNSRAPSTLDPFAEKRRSRRYSVQIPGVVSWMDGGTERVENVFTTSISKYGCALRTGTFHKPGTRLRLEFSGKSIEGKAVHALKDHSNNMVTVGVAFEENGRNFWQVGFDLEPQGF
jgi:hypothetical protein